MDLDSQFLNTNAVYNFMILAAEGPENPLSLTQLVNFINPTLRYLFRNSNLPQVSEADIINVLPELQSESTSNNLGFHHVYFILSHIFYNLNYVSGFNNEFNQDLFKDVRGPSELELQRIHLYKDTNPTYYSQLWEEVNERTSAARAAAIQNRRAEIVNAGNYGAGKKRKTKKAKRSRKSRKSRKA
jgi:hypothetical protein